MLEVRTDTVLAGTRYADAVLAACGVLAAAWQFREGDRMLAGAVGGHRGRIAPRTCCSPSAPSSTSSSAPAASPR